MIQLLKQYPSVALNVELTDLRRDMGSIVKCEFWESCWQEWFTTCIFEVL